MVLSILKALRKFMAIIMLCLSLGLIEAYDSAK